jgi:putative salt-induced outer membrane protein
MTVLRACAMAVAAILIGAVARHAGAQPVSQPDGQWRSLVNVGLTHATGNTNATTLTAKVDTVRATVDDKWTLYAEALRARSAGVTSGDRERLGGRYDWNLTPRVFSLTSLDLERDVVAALSHRVSLAAGLGYKFFDREDLHFNVFGGLGYADDRYFVPREAGGELRTRFSRPNALLGEESSHKFSPTTTATQRLVVNSDLQAAGNHRAQWDGSLAVAMTRTISLSIGLNARYDSAPGIGLKRADTLLTTGIAVKFE